MSTVAQSGILRDSLGGNGFQKVAGLKESHEITVLSSQRSLEIEAIFEVKNSTQKWARLPSHYNLVF